MYGIQFHCEEKKTDPCTGLFITTNSSSVLRVLKIATLDDLYCDCFGISKLYKVNNNKAWVFQSFLGSSLRDGH